jgi:hypothetical protein
LVPPSGLPFRPRRRLHRISASHDDYLQEQTTFAH